MPHAPGTGRRSPKDVLIDAAKPQVEKAIHDHGGTIAFAIPVVGDILRGMVRVMGPKAFSTTVLWGGGLLEIPRGLFPAGSAGDKLYTLVNDGVDELGRSIAEKGEGMTETQLETQIGGIIARLLGKTGAKAPEGAKPMADGQLVIERRRVGTDTHVTIHELICPLYDRTIETKGTPPAPAAGGKPAKGGGPKRIPNPDILQAPREQALALEAALPNVTVCNCVKAVAATVKPAEKQSTGGRKKPAAIIGELNAAEQTAFWAWISNLAPTDRQYVMTEIERRLTDVKELRAIMATPEDLRIAAVGLLTDVITEHVEHLVDAVGAHVGIMVDDLRLSGEEVTISIEDARLRLRGKSAALRAKLGRP